MISKRGQLGEGILGIVKVFVVAIIAFIVFGVSNLSYSHYITVRDPEAFILGKQTIDCLAPDGELDINMISGKERIFSYCGFSGHNLERFFVRVIIRGPNGEEIREYVQGDESVLWVKKIYDSGVGTDSIKKYEPGYFNSSYDVSVIDKTSKFPGKLHVEVMVENEF
jgi:hypothetical protein